MNWNEANLLGDLEAQEERGMTGDLVKQTIAELQDIVHCDCTPDYRDRGRHSHVCLYYMAGPLEVVANRLENLEAKLAKAVEALDKIKRINNLVGVFAACERTLAELTGDGNENDTN